MFDMITELLASRQATHGDQYAMVREYPSRESISVPWARLQLASAVTRVLAAEFPDGPFRHQASAVAYVQLGKNVVVTTPTASGKSLIYTIPIAEALIASDDATALLLFPTKALANDQLNTLNRRLAAILTESGKDHRPHLVARYDGSTDRDSRADIRQSVRVLLTNPDMAHLALLQWHDPHWVRFLSNLRYIILDEAHEYRGTFGTNVSLLFRRLLLLCKRYGSTPVFISTSATIQDPAQHLHILTSKRFEVIPPDADGSMQGPKRFWIVKASVHPFATARALLEALVERDKMVIAFCLLRKSTEENAEHFINNTARRIRAYRAGLLPRERQEIEEGLRNGSVRGVFATSALELGIDIGRLDVCICIGLPNTMMSLWQRAGRVGRGGKPGAVILIPEARPMDAYLAEHPRVLFSRPNEPLAINMNSRTLAKWHYACSIKEAGGNPESISPAELGMPMEQIALDYRAGVDDNIFHTDNPHLEYDIRAGSDPVFELKLAENCPDPKVGDISTTTLTPWPLAGAYVFQLYPDSV